MGLIVSLIVGAGILFAVVAVFYFHARRLQREQKNYERGLKMVPLLIHLPPISDDVEGGSRDTRDVVDETISKAQLVYNIIGDTVQKGHKSRYYGQRHFSFEIIGIKGMVHFYAAVPVSLQQTVEQAVISAYPSARLEEVAEHNIFSPIGKISGTAGGELTLKEEYAYPIATYQDLKRDALQSVLNSLSTLDKEDGAGIQFLIRPADPEWRKKAKDIADKKRKGDDKSKGGAAFLKTLATAAVKPPEGSDKDKPKEKKELSSLEQSIVDSMDDKTRYAGFEVLIRIVASSNVSQRSNAILNNIKSSFALFDAPGKNGFKYTPAKDIESFVTAFIMRFFPAENNQNILNSVELATLFHFPDESNIPTSQLERQASKQVDGPRNISESGTMLGYNIFRGAKKRINLDREDRRRHIYSVGQTGTGKSTFLENLALQDMLDGNGFAFIDPHGDVVENLIAKVPKERTEDVIYFNPSDLEYPLGLNMLEFNDPDQKDFLIQESIGMLYKLYDPQRQGIIGPRYEHLFRNAALTIMADPAGGTFIDIPKLFNDDQYVKQKLKHVTDGAVLDFWLKEMPASQRSNEFGEVKSWFVSKFGAFLSNQMMRNIIGQTKSSFDLRDIMDNKKILLVNLSKGKTGELNSKLLGMIFVMKFQAAAMSRANIDEKDRVDFSLYVDEFQNFSTDSFASILSEARKYHLSLIVANQFTTQLTEEIRDAVFGNIGSIISFRVGTNDAEFLAKYFAPVFDIHDLQRVPNHNAIVRMLIGGVPTQAFSMATLAPLGTPNPQLATALKQLSAAKFGAPRAKVEADIFTRLKSPDPPAKPAFGAGGTGAFGAPASGQPAFGASAGMPAGTPAGPPKPASFLDDWLAKRQQPAGQPRPPAFGAPNATVPGAKDVQPTSQDRFSPEFLSSPEKKFDMSAIPQPEQALQPLQALQTAPSLMEAPNTLMANQTAPAAHMAATNPFAAPSAAVQEQQGPQGARNITSNGIEQQEVSKIADKLKEELNGGVLPTPAPAPDMPKPEQPSHGELKNEDTIAIDNEGTITFNGAPTDKPSAA